MSSQYGLVIYGIPMSQVKDFFDRLKDEEVEDQFNLTPEVRKELIEEWEEGDPPFGFKKLYSASGDDREFGYLGIKLRSEISTFTSIKLGEIVAYELTDEKKKKVAAMIKELPEPLRNFVGKPDVWMVWGST